VTHNARAARRAVGQKRASTKARFQVGCGMLARVISLEADEGGVVTLSIDGVQIAAMNHLGYGASSQAVPSVGDEFVVSFSCLFPDDVSWGSVFSDNPSGRSELVRTGLWSYRAFGTLVAIDARGLGAIAKCGPFELPLPVEVSDSSLVGSPVAFEVQRLDAWRA
jgi:hypothetical protein